MENDIEDIGIVAWHEDGRWQVTLLNELEDLAGILSQMRSEDSAANTLALISKGEEYFVAIHIRGEEVEIALSDVLSADESDLAADILDELDLPMPDDYITESQPAGDTGLFSEYGITAMEFEAIANDFDLFPDEQIEALVARLGFMEQYLEIVE